MKIKWNESLLQEVGLNSGPPRNFNLAVTRSEAIWGSQMAKAT